MFFSVYKNEGLPTQERVVKMEDLHIIDLYWERNEHAIQETEKKYGGYCHSIALNILTDRADAEECVNDTYYQTWNSIPPNRPSSLKAWLGKLCRNNALNIWNKYHAQKRYRGMDLLLSELEECIPASVSIEREIEDSEISDCISAWLRSLPAGDRALFVRRYWYGEAVRSLAKERNIPAKNLTQKMFRLRKGLKSALEKEGISL